MSEASDSREPAGVDPCSDDAPVQGAAGPAPAASSSSTASPEQRLTIEGTTEMDVQEERTCVAVQGAEDEVLNGVAETATQEVAAEVAQEVAEEVAQEVVEEVAQEETVPIGDDRDQQGEVELAEDILEPMGELPLDEELVEMLPIVMEDPENEAKEQKALLEGSVEETNESKKEGHSAVPESEPLKCQSDELDSPNVENEGDIKTTQESGQAGDAQNDADDTRSEQTAGFREEWEAEEVADATPAKNSTFPSEICAAELQESKEESKNNEPIAPALELKEHVEHTYANEKLTEITSTSELVELAETSAPSETPTETKREQQPVSAEEEGQSQSTEVLIPGELQQTSAPSEGDAQISKPTAETEEGTKEPNDEDKKEKKKRKKSKEERKTKKSVGEKESPREEKSSKPALMHVRGGFSCGWVGPVLQLLDTMKKLDEFKECHGKRYTPKGQEYGQRPDIPDSASVAQEDAPPNPALEIPEAAIRAPPGEGCPRCGGAVFEAERMKSRFRSYHKPCFNCKACHRILDSTLACDGPDKDVYCKLCYAKKYGPKGYGFGGGKAFLQSDIITVESPESKPEWVKLDRTTIKPTEGSGCPRCGGAVFAAELMMSKGQEWHISCFSCRDCKRPLDSTIACDGPDMEIYCKVDYAKRFGPKGFGFGHGPTLVSFVHEDEDEQSPTGGQVAAQPMGSKAAPGEGCPRCGFAVYAAETMLHNGKAYHRHCFSCGECSRSLDSTNTCSGPGGQLLCRSCYGKLFGPHGVGYGQGAGVLSMV